MEAQCTSLVRMLTTACDLRRRWRFPFSPANHDANARTAVSIRSLCRGSLRNPNRPFRSGTPLQPKLPGREPHTRPRSRAGAKTAASLCPSVARSTIRTKALRTFDSKIERNGSLCYICEKRIAGGVLWNSTEDTNFVPCGQHSAAPCAMLKAPAFRLPEGWEVKNLPSPPAVCRTSRPKALFPASSVFTPSQRFTVVTIGNCSPGTAWI
jgi:hypothetical protein